jgi:hypothetical protein
LSDERYNSGCGKFKHQGGRPMAKTQRQIEIEEDRGWTVEIKLIDANHLTIIATKPGRETVSLPVASFGFIRVEDLIDKEDTWLPVLTDIKLQDSAYQQARGNRWPTDIATGGELLSVSEAIEYLQRGNPDLIVGKTAQPDHDNYKRLAKSGKCLQECTCGMRNKQWTYPECVMKVGDNKFLSVGATSDSGIISCGEKGYHSERYGGGYDCPSLNAE